MILAATSTYVGAVPSRRPCEQGPLELASLPKSKRFPPKLLGGAALVLRASVGVAGADPVVLRLLQCKRRPPRLT
jgi:hypothetical protein